MSRQKRKLSRTGLYHIMFKGISDIDILKETDDYDKLKEIILKIKNETGFKLYAYCLIKDHAHLFIKENKTGEISKIMSKILSNYASWFNFKYKRSGPLFFSRYKSEPLEDKEYYLPLVRYIHNNALDIRRIKKLSEYPHSSYNEYINNSPALTDIDFILDLFSEDRMVAIEAFIAFSEENDEEIYEITDSGKMSSFKIKKIIKNELNSEDIDTIKYISKDERDRIIKKLVNEFGVSKSELERITGISRGTIIRICNPQKTSYTRRKRSYSQPSKSQSVPSFFD